MHLTVLMINTLPIQTEDNKNSNIEIKLPKAIY